MVTYWVTGIFTDSSGFHTTFALDVKSPEKIREYNLKSWIILCCKAVSIEFERMYPTNIVVQNWKRIHE